jgi:hypothetical protein
MPSPSARLKQRLEALWPREKRAKPPIRNAAGETYRVMQIEVSNLCSLTCDYCPHPTQKRPKGDMSFETFKKCVELVERSANPEYRGRKFLWLNHFVDPLLNPLLPDFIAYATSRNLEVSFASNAVDYDKKLFPREMWRKLAQAGLNGVSLSAHAKSEAKLRDHVGDIVKVIGMWKPKPEYLHDWAGQVDMGDYKMAAPPPSAERPCDYQLHNMFTVRWDGKLAACCYDIEGQVPLSIDDVLREGFKFRAVPLCTNCRLGRGDADWLLDPLKQIYG